MVHAIRHRGPDGEGYWINGPVGLGHCRLAVRDLSDQGRQPVADPTGRVIVIFNGEIYNDGELRSKLSREMGITFQTRCDAEVIPYCYLAWGIEGFRLLEGMFAIALWDCEQQQLYLVRDPLGIKPLYYNLTEDEVRFGSELKAVLVGAKAQIDRAALHSFFALGYVGPDASLLKGYRQVPPGTIIKIDQQAVWQNRYWSPPTRRPEIKCLDDAVDAFREIWPKVVSDHTQSDVEIGVLQSGGIDSSLVSLQLGRVAAKSPGRARLFTAGFESTAFDETHAADSLAAAAGLPIERVPIELLPGEATHVFTSIVSHFDGQNADSSAFAVYLLCRAVRTHVKVALTGDGADELFGGYSTYKAARYAPFLRHLLPSGYARMVAGWLFKSSGPPPHRRISRRELAGRFLEGAVIANGVPHSAWRRYLREADARLLYGPELLPCLHDDPLHHYAHAWNQAEGGWVERALLADQSFYLPADMLMKMDAMSMAHGLEVRVPFLDRRVVELAARMDVRLLSPALGQNKAVLRAALERLGGGRRLAGAPKQGFNVPIDSMLRGSLRQFGEDVLLRKGNELSSLVRAEALARLWEEHQAKRANHGFALWALLSFFLWFQMNKDKIYV